MKYFNLKTKTFLSLLLFSFLNTVVVVAQRDYYRFTDPDDTADVVRFSLASVDYLPDDINGTPYENEKFQLGAIYENNQPAIKNIYFRFNAFADHIEIKSKQTDDDSKISILKKSPNIIVKINNEYLLYDENVKGYYQILFIGDNFKLYKKNYKKYTKPRRAKTSFEKNILASYKDKIFYYLVDKEGVFHELPNSKKKRIKFFGNKKTEIETYLKKYDLDINDEKILIKIVRYFNSFKDAIL